MKGRKKEEKKSIYVFSNHRDDVSNVLEFRIRTRNFERFSTIK